MKTKGFWIIKTSAGSYWTSGGFDLQIRKAHVYAWKEKAEEAIEVFVRRKYLPEEITYEVVAIAEPKELKDTEAEWIFKPALDEDEYDYICSNCGYCALNNYRGLPVASKFCPHCGKYMTNHQMEDDE